MLVIGGISEVKERVGNSKNTLKYERISQYLRSFISDSTPLSSSEKPKGPVQKRRRRQSDDCADSGGTIQNSQIALLVNQLLSERNDRNEGKENDDPERAAMVDMYRVKLRRVPDARLDAFQEELFRLIKFYVSNPDSTLSMFED